MNLEKEKELFKLAYLNLRTADSIPFPDAVFDEYVRLRDSEGYKLVPVETLEEALSWGNCASSESWNDEQREEIDKHYRVIEKSMIGVVE